jgi:5-methylcytosine-specific restriction endonuclease McrA
MRQDPYWKDWIKSRDKNTCQGCGKRGGKMHAHHIYPVEEYPEKRNDLANGVTLCPMCHSRAHIYHKDPDLKRLIGRGGLTGKALGA